MEKVKLQANSQLGALRWWESFEDVYSKEGVVEQEWMRKLEDERVWRGIPS